jgi:ADP-ribosylation factor related protein 1
MFSLVYGLFEYLFRREEYHILILGLDKAGKTNVLERLKTMYTEVVGLAPGKILPTVGLNVGRVEAFGNQLVFWDLGGQSGLQSIWDKYYDESHAVIYVVDSANEARFAESKQALDRVLGSIDLIGAPVILMANKQDLPEALSPHDVAEIFGFGQVDSRPTKIVPVCAYTGQGLKESAEWLVQMMKRSPRTARLRVKNMAK